MDGGGRGEGQDLTPTRAGRAATPVDRSPAGQGNAGQNLSTDERRGAWQPSEGTSRPEHAQIPG